jgi:hypothetical protein
MAGTIDAAIEKKRDEDPARSAKKQQKVERDAERSKPAERERPDESSRELPETD